MELLCGFCDHGDRAVHRDLLALIQYKGPAEICFRVVFAWKASRTVGQLYQSNKAGGHVPKLIQRIDHVISAEQGWLDGVQHCCEMEDW